MQDKTKIQQQYGQRIREVMDIRGVSVGGVALACSVTDSTVYKWLDGSNGIADHQLLIILDLLAIPKELLDRNLLDLFNGHESNTLDRHVRVIYADRIDAQFKCSPDQVDSMISSLIRNQLKN